MKQDAMNRLEEDFSRRWFVDRSAVAYAVENNVSGVIPNTTVLKESFDYAGYRASVEEPLPKFKARSRMIEELEDMIQEEGLPL